MNGEIKTDELKKMTRKEIKEEDKKENTEPVKEEVLAPNTEVQEEIVTTGPETQTESQSSEETPSIPKPTEEKPISDEEEMEEIIDEETGEKLPFPEAAVVRIMKRNMDGEKMIRKEVKIAMNKWLGDICANISKEMDKFPYVMMNLNEFKEGIKVFEDLERFDREKERILSHFDMIKKDIEKLEWDLGKRKSLLEGEDVEYKQPLDKKRKVIESAQIEENDPNEVVTEDN
ncbi:MAG: hypothetical protein ISS36_04030 [Candidatus Aenigmarchaeota archaeon]|nr:hypothetical protein [Candidatus Aenigmarchaeota archaeon]